MAHSKEAQAGSEKTLQRGPKAERPIGNFVRATTRTLELTKVGHAVNFKIYQKGHLLGRLEVGLGALRWRPARSRVAETKLIPWKVFATMIREWPFGEPVDARLKFEKGRLRWRSQGKKGPGRKMSWDELVQRMDVVLSSGPPDPPVRSQISPRTAKPQRARRPSKGAP